MYSSYTSFYFNTFSVLVILRTCSPNTHTLKRKIYLFICKQGGITRERIVALFTFVGDVAVHQVRHRGEQFLSVLLKWSFRYLVDHICKWVQEAGGWVSRLNGFEYLCCLLF